MSRSNNERLAIALHDQRILMGQIEAARTREEKAFIHNRLVKVMNEIIEYRRIIELTTGEAA